MLVPEIALGIILAPIALVLAIVAAPIAIGGATLFAMYWSYQQWGFVGVVVSMLIYIGIAEGLTHSLAMLYPKKKIPVSKAKHKEAA